MYRKWDNIYFVIEMFCNNINVFTVSFHQFIVSLLNKSITQTTTKNKNKKKPLASNIWTVVYLFKEYFRKYIEKQDTNIYRATLLMAANNVPTLIYKFCYWNISWQTVLEMTCAVLAYYKQHSQTGRRINQLPSEDSVHMTENILLTW